MKEFYILSLKWSRDNEQNLTWWMPNRSGYTSILEHAGRYSAAEAKSHEGSDTTIAVPCEVVDRLSSRVMPSFECKGYTRATMMLEALRSIGRRVTSTMFKEPEAQGLPLPWPRYGLCRLQWEGPWTQPSVPIRARYRYTHWVGVGPLYSSNGSPIPGETCIWDVNTLDIGNGWAPLAAWTRATVPSITSGIPGATGGWHITHAIEVERPEAVTQRGTLS